MTERVEQDQWSYFVSYDTGKDRATRVRAVFRTRPGSPGEDYIFTKNGWRQSNALALIRTGRTDDEAVEIGEEEADRLTEEIRARRMELLRQGVADMAAILRANGSAERAAELEALHDSLAGGPHIEEQLYDLATATPVPDPVTDDDTIVRYNRAQAAVQGMTQKSQR